MHQKLFNNILREWEIVEQRKVHGFKFRFIQSKMMTIFVLKDILLGCKNLVQMLNICFMSESACLKYDEVNDNISLNRNIAIMIKFRCTKKEWLWIELILTVNIGKVYLIEY